MIPTIALLYQRYGGNLLLPMLRLVKSKVVCKIFCMRVMIKYLSRFYNFIKMVNKTKIMINCLKMTKELGGQTREEAKNLL